ncbi:hypothetical protein ACA910_008839 [Epithemia clementina (nom. ined.)]
MLFYDSNNENNNSSCSRAAVALNNLATALLELGYFELASHTLHDGVAMMKLAFSNPKHTTAVVAAKDAEPHQQPSKHQESSPTTSPERGLCRAYRRYARALAKRQQRCCTTASRRAVLPQSQRQHEVQVLDSDNIQGLKHAVHYGPSASVVFPIRIVSSSTPWTSSGGCNDVDEEATSELTTNLGILLFNHGLANYRKASSSCSSSSSISKKERNDGKNGKNTKKNNNKKYGNKCMMERALKSLKMAHTAFLPLATTMARSKGAAPALRCAIHRGDDDDYDDDDQNNIWKEDEKAAEPPAQADDQEGSCGGSSSSSIMRISLLLRLLVAHTGNAMSLIFRHQTRWDQVHEADQMVLALLSSNLAEEKEEDDSAHYGDCDVRRHIKNPCTAPAA